MLTLTLFELALSELALPLAIRTDNGTPFARFRRLAEDLY